MKIWKSQYEPPAAPYRPGQKLRIGGKTHTVIASSHTHTQLEGIRYAVSNWVITQLKKGLGDKDLALPKEVDNSLFSRITDPSSPTTEYHTSKEKFEAAVSFSNELKLAADVPEKRSTRGTKRKKSPGGRNPTGCDLNFFFKNPLYLHLTLMLILNFQGNKESLGEFRRTA